VTEKQKYEEYLSHNKVIVEVLSLICGFLFTSITIILTFVQDGNGILVQATILFLTLIFYFSLYVLLDNLEMVFHYIEEIPPMTLKVRPFFNLMLIIYLFGSSTVLMFLLFKFLYLAIVCAAIWLIFILISINLTARRFYKQSVKRVWKKAAS